MLITCPECGKKRSDEADACPHCGCKRTSSGSGCGAVILLAIMIFALKMCNTDTAETYITKNNVNFRDAPNGQVLGQMPKGTKVICAMEDGWCKTQKDDQSVYISLKVLVKNAPVKKKEVSERKNTSDDVDNDPVRDVPVKKKKGLIAAIGE